ncbi:hypothetical protein [Leptothoe sp. PORK10 BA2]|uniref:hypothetical protein n=1 Tax=Leptothoe sp. PORK10 BA2 TaxID=3110254 RepID=UPI002B2078D0|nr:hypothetical protein [Leptothoe sp. PORK10 BA2]MEA5466970.1 hypothetical protein [Leptothoe sp. PORK10 BA2]
MTDWTGQAIVDALVKQLPITYGELQNDARTALSKKDYQRCKIYPCLALDDAYIKAIGYMSSIPAVADQGMPTLATLVAESCRAIAEAHAQAERGIIDEPEPSEREKARFKAINELELITQEIFSKAVPKA